MANHPALQRHREYAGPALFSYGFRPFFLFAGVWAVVSLPLWLHQYYGDIALPTHLTPMDWHIHEMLYGYATAAIAGFLLTAIPNWTGRLPVNGRPLASLAALWIAGRLTMMFSAKIGGVVAATIDSAFLLCLGAVAAREIVAGKNWRNLRVLGMIAVLAAGNIVFHIEAQVSGSANYGTRMAIVAVILLVSLIGGRIIPSFTRNWLVKNNPGRLPIPFSRFDVFAIVASAIGALAWIAAPAHQITGILLMVAGLLQFVRLARWAGDRTLADRLVVVLHVGYAFVPLGFVMIGLSAFIPVVPSTAGVHAWTAGAIGLMTIAVMTRATLGHTGGVLRAGVATQVIYALVLSSATLRIIAAFTRSTDLIEVAAVCWLLGFGLFTLVFGRLLIQRRQ